MSKKEDNKIAELREKYLVNRIVKTEVYIDQIWQFIKDNCNGFDIYEYEFCPTKDELEQKKVQLRIKGEI
jgi:hypothetical protein